MEYYGQAAQDLFVLNALNYKTNGFFLEIGSNDPIKISNTYKLETSYGWKGIMVERDSKFLNSYKTTRPNSYPIIADACTIDYAAAFKQYGAPANIDYLQIDLEVTNGSTITVLNNLNKQVMDNYKFAVVTFETDIYRGDYFNTQQLSRDIFEKRGYIRLFSDVNTFEDWYVHPDLVDIDYINSVKSDKQLTYQEIIGIVQQYRIKRFLKENGMTFGTDGKMNVPDYAGIVKLDIGTCFHAPMSQYWLDNELGLFVFGFEPSPFAIEQLRNGPDKNLIEKNIKTYIFNTAKYLNKRFFLVPCALGAAEGSSLFYMTEPNTGCSSTHELTDQLLRYGIRVERTSTVPVFKLSTFFDMFPFDRFHVIDHIKIDAQGSDLDIIKGGGEYIRDRVVCITAECETRYANTVNSEADMNSYMTSIGFERIHHPHTVDPTYVNLKYKSRFDVITSRNIFQKG